jgi:hypothetical protein
MVWKNLIIHPQKSLIHTPEIFFIGEFMRRVGHAGGVRVAHSRRSADRRVDGGDAVDVEWARD